MRATKEIITGDLSAAVVYIGFAKKLLRSLKKLNLKGRGARKYKAERLVGSDADIRVSVYDGQWLGNKHLPDVIKIHAPDGVAIFDFIYQFKNRFSPSLPRELYGWNRTGTAPFLLGSHLPADHGVTTGNNAMIANPVSGKFEILLSDYSAYPVKKPTGILPIKMGKNSIKKAPGRVMAGGQNAVVELAVDVRTKIAHAYSGDFFRGTASDGVSHGVCRKIANLAADMTPLFSFPVKYCVYQNGDQIDDGDWGGVTGQQRIVYWPPVYAAESKKFCGDVLYVTGYPFDTSGYEPNITAAQQAFAYRQIYRYRRVEGVDHFDFMLSWFPGLGINDSGTVQPSEIYEYYHSTMDDPSGEFGGYCVSTRRVGNVNYYNSMPAYYATYEPRIICDDVIFRVFKKDAVDWKIPHREFILKWSEVFGIDPLGVLADNYSFEAKDIKNHLVPYIYFWVISSSASGEKYGIAWGSYGYSLDSQYWVQDVIGVYDTETGIFTKSHETSNIRTIFVLEHSINPYNTSEVAFLEGDKFSFIENNTWPDTGKNYKTHILDILTKDIKTVASDKKTYNMKFAR